MYNTRPQAPWNPYTIPATPNVTSKSYGGDLVAEDPYILSAKSGAESGKNPSQFLEWSQVPINYIIEKLDELIAKIEELDAKVDQFDGRITSVEESINTINSRLNSASINAVCNNGTVTVTLNL